MLQHWIDLPKNKAISPIFLFHIDQTDQLLS